MNVSMLERLELELHGIELVLELLRRELVELLVLGVVMRLPPKMRTDSDKVRATTSSAHSRI